MGLNWFHWQSFMGVIVLLTSLFQLCFSVVIFYESFDKDFEYKWIIKAADKDNYQDGWKLAKKYGIVRALNEPFSLKSGTVVLQFEFRLDKGLECGAAYFKYLSPQEEGWGPEEFVDESLYSIMFGPEICGSTSKVHFVLNHKNPKTGKYVEHHLKSPPLVPSDKLSHVYTAILKPNNDLVILIDGKHKKHANFLHGHDFEPPIIPVKKISDPNDKKPEDRDERAKILDPEAVKPNEWDEKTDEFTPLKLEDLYDEENGDSGRPKIKSPLRKSVLGLCARKNSSKIGNSVLYPYRKKWSAPLIGNPNYRGTWKAKEILNPDYYELDTLEYRPIRAIGIEIWMTGDIRIWLDDILIATSEEDAETYREKIWKPKLEADKEDRKAKQLPAWEERLQPLWEKLLDLISKCNYKMNVTRGQHGTNIVSLTISCGVFCWSIFYEF